jgi:hypothetical protein
MYNGQLKTKPSALPREKNKLGPNVIILSSN